MQLKRWVVLAVAFALATTACKKPGNQAGAGGPGKAASSSTDQALAAKLSSSIDCLNRHSGRVFEVRDEYLADVDPDKGPEPGKELPLLGLYGLEPCRTDIKKAAALTPAMPELDQAALAYIAALESLVSTYEDLGGYYKKGEYRTDNGKRASELHPKLLAAFKAFGEAHATLDDRVGAENRKKRVADLAAREKAEGRKLGVVLDAMMLDAETLVGTLSGGPDQVLSADVAMLDTRLATYAKGVDEFAAYLRAHDDEAQKVGSRASLVDYSQRFLGAARVVADKVKAKTPPTRADLDQATEQFNHLVDNYNRTSL